MMMKLTTALGVLLLANLSFSQEIITPIKPVDERPATFTSQEHMDQKKQAKIEAIKDQIIANQDNPEKVRALRIQLWRFENAIVVNNK